MQALLAARIDRLPPEDKRLLQTAAVIGTEVPWPLLQAIADTPDEALYRSLAQLQAAEFLYETSLFPERAYTFKHALTHEVAYGSLLHERRRVLHARIVEALEALAGDRLDDQVERLAQHALRGEVWDKALAYGRQAGDKAQARSAYREAVVCFEQALAALEHVPDSRAATEQAIDLRLGLRTALNALGEAPGRMLDHLRRAETLAQTLGDQLRLGRVYADHGRQFLGGGRGGPRHRLRPACPGPGRTRSGMSASRPGRISSWVGPITTRETILGPSRVWSGMWRPSRETCAMNALAPMAASRQPPGPG